LKDLYQESSQEQDQQEQEFQVEQGKQQLSADLLATQQALLGANRKYNAALRAKPFNPSAIIEAKNEIAALEAGIKDLKELEAMF
jgi:hypothetical protein